MFKNKNGLDVMRDLAKKDPQHFSFTMIGGSNNKSKSKDKDSNHNQK